MAISVDVGTFNLATGTGTTATTGVGFTPEFLLLWCPFQTATGVNSGFKLSIGASDGTNDRCIEVTGTDASAFAAQDRLSSANIITSRNYNSRGTPVRLAVDLDSFDADGFTLDYTTNALATAFKAQYLALGGADLTNVKVGHFSGPTSTGDSAVTGVGFAADCLILLDPVRFATFPGNQPSMLMGIGIGTATSPGVVTSFYGADGASPAVSGRGLRGDKIVRGFFTGGGTAQEATLASLDADGFTLNWTTTLNSTPEIMFIALKGGSYEVGVAPEPVTTGNKVVNVSAGLTPKAVLLCSANAAATPLEQPHARFSLGASDDTADLSVWEGFTDGVSASSADTQVDETHCILITDQDTPSVAQSTALVDGFAAGSFTLNWDTVGGGGGREYMFLAIGNAAGGAATQILNLSGAGIAPNEAFGTVVISPGAGTVDLTDEGITPQESIGTPTMAGGASTLDLTGFGIAPQETLGLPQLNHIKTMSGIAPNEALGTFTILQDLPVTGIAPNEAIGIPSFVLAGANQTVFVFGIGPNEALGSPTMLPGNVNVTMSGIGPNEALGTVTLSHILAAVGIAPNEAFGSPAMSPGKARITMTGIGPNEALGIPVVVLVTGTTFKGWLKDQGDANSIGKLFTLDTARYPGTAQYFFRFYIRTVGGAAFPVSARVALLSGASTFTVVSNSAVQSNEKVNLDEVITAGAIGVSAGSHQYRIEYGGASAQTFECAGGGFIVRSA